MGNVLQIIIAFVFGAIAAAVVSYFIIKNNKKWFAEQFSRLDLEINKIQATTVPDFIAKVKEAIEKIKL
jgi:hypothetical protein